MVESLWLLVAAIPVVFWIYRAISVLLLSSRSGAEITQRGVALYAIYSALAGFWLATSLMYAFYVLDWSLWLTTIRLIAYLIVVASLMFGMPLKRLFRARQDVEDYVRRGNTQLDAGRGLDENESLREALDLYLEAIHAAPRSWAGHYGAGLALFELGMRSSGQERRSHLTRARGFAEAAGKLAAGSVSEQQTQELLGVIRIHELSEQASG